ncbi:hypothetical protein BC941DRAFT_508936 [Chlamydoabsidia padenii]|nr:hypothetical protein BC941DRAFT_508936 [Chlamydoabsidia padenii]
MDNQSTSTLSIPSKETLDQRKEGIRNVYQANESEPYPLISDASLLSNLSIKDLAESYVYLWSKYNTLSSNPQYATFQLSCRLYDLCCRAKVLHEAYMKYLSRPPTNISKLPFHAWMVSFVSKVDNGDMPPKAHAGKKSIMKSLPLNETTRQRILDFVSTYGLGLLACEELLPFGSLNTMTNSEYTQLETSLSDVKDQIISVFNESSINSAFEPTAAKELYTTVNANGK